MRYELARDALAIFVRVRRAEMTMSEAAEVAGVSKAQIFRAEHNQPLDAGAVLALILWMKMNPFQFLRDTETGRTLARLPKIPIPRVLHGKHQVKRQVKPRIKSGAGSRIKSGAGSRVKPGAGSGVNARRREG